MKRFLFRFSALLIGATLSVVALATALLFLVGDRPDFSDATEALAVQVRMARELTPEAMKALGTEGYSVGLHDSRPNGHILEGATRDLRKLMASQRLDQNAIVEVLPSAGWATIAIELRDGRWLTLPASFPAPPKQHFIARLGGWMFLIALGVSGIALFAAYRIARPFGLVESAINRIDPDGNIELLPETGPDEVRIMAKALNRLANRLKSATESKMRLVAAAGHDLRTPLTRLRLRAELLDREDQQRWLNDLEELERIADSAIRLVREETESTRLEPVRIDEMVKTLSDELRDLALPVVLDRCDPAEIQGRPFAIKRAIRNLIFNAATHGLRAEISVIKSAAHVVVAIDDEGPGIPDHLLQQVFEPFFRVDSARRTAIPGAGLGLAIAKEILDRNGAHFTIANRLEGGLSQTIVFPIGHTSEDETAPAQASTEHLQ